jgi:uncharacterized repeat protein (TIGR01451 family)
MKSPHTALGHRRGPESNVLRPTAGRRLPTSSRKKITRFGLLAVCAVAFAATLFPASSATSPRRAARSVDAAAAPAAQTPTARTASRHAAMTAAAALFAPPVFTPETVDTYSADCLTPKSTFALGETVCARVSGAPADRRRLDWADTYPIVVRQSAPISTDPQTDLFTIPSAQTTDVLGRTVDNRGTWRVNSTSTIDGTVYASAFFTVRDPSNPSVELSLSNVVRIGANKVAAGANVSFQVLVTNQGPDAAQNVQLKNDSPASTTFVSIAPDSGFSCTGPVAGGTGLTTCTAGSLPAGSSATFTLVYKVDPGTPNGTIISDTAQVSTDTSEQNPADDALTAETVVNTPPCVITPPADITLNNDLDPQTNRALGGAVVVYSDPTVTSGCDVAEHPVDCSPASGSFFPVGGNIATCSNDLGDSTSFNVNVIDTEAPTFTSCPGNISVTESAPGAGAVVNYTSAATDNSGQATVTCDHESGSTFPEGTTHVVCTAADAAGHTAACNFDVEVSASNQTTCHLSCPADITVSAALGVNSVAVNYPSPSTNGNCGTVTYNLPPGSFFTTGTTTPVTATAKDADGNTLDSCSFNVTVNTSDTTPPAFDACPAGVSLDADPGGCSASVSLTPPVATDSQSTPTVTASRSDGQPLSAPFLVGTVVVTWTATDAAGNTAECEQPVTVTETTPPAVSGLAPKTVYLDADCQAFVPDFIGGLNITDNCTPRANLEVTQVPAAETLIGAGSHTVQITVKDVSGNVTTASTTLNVVDNTPPVITLNQPELNPLTVECHTVLTDPGATATDNCTATVTSANDVNVNAPGTYAITYTATDGTNTVTATRTVHVVDTQPPTLALNGAATMTIECHTGFTDPGATASDGCAGDLTGAIQVTGSVNPNAVGAYTLNYTVSDGQGHTASATRTVNVVDTTPPTLNVPANIVVNAPANSCSVTLNPGTATATDSCAGVAVNVTGTRSDGQPLNDPYPLGTTTITWKATDASNNTTTGAQTVKVNDVTPPTIVLTTNTINLSPPNHSYQTFSIADLVASVSDGCDASVDINDVVISKATSDEVENGNGSGNTTNDIVIAANCKSLQLRREREGGGDGRVYTITLQARDASGNLATAIRRVFVPKGNGPAVDSGMHYTVNGCNP